MTIIKWDESLTLGIQEIDDQHKRLINMINELHLALEYGKSSDVILPVIERLKEYADRHFLDEERLFVDLDYPGVSDHKQEHVNFIAKIQDLNKQFSYNREFLAINIRDLLLTWFFHHIRTKDLEYKKLIRS